MYFFVEVDLEREHYIVGIERLAVGKTQSFAKLESECAAVVRSAPGLGQPRLCLLCIPVYMNEVSRHAADRLSRAGIRGSNRIQSLGLGGLGDDQCSPYRPTKLLVC